MAFCEIHAYVRRYISRGWRIESILLRKYCGDWITVLDAFGGFVVRVFEGMLGSAKYSRKMVWLPKLLLSFFS